MRCGRAAPIPSVRALRTLAPAFPRSVGTLSILLLLSLTACVGPLTASQQVPRAAGVADSARTPTSTPAKATSTPGPSTVNGRQVDQTAMNGAVSWYLDHMTLDQKLGQMMLVETVWTGYNADVDNMVHGMHAGAMIIYNQNMSSQAQLSDYIATIQAHADLPMLISTDQEGGVVNRLLPFIGLQPSAQDMASSGNPDVARQLGSQWAHELLALGINTDLAPVVDVRTDPAAIEFTRLFGNDPATVDRFAGAFLQGAQDAGVIGTLKHWPGIGSITLDPHDTLPTITRSHAQLEATDFATFRDLLADQPGMIMVTHVIVQAIDPNMPATLSPALVNGVLRGELGYQGVVMTDSLYMRGISIRYSLGEAAVLSILAGDDLLEGAWDSGSTAEMINAVKAALASGRLTEDRINQSVRRILALKIRFGLLPLHPYSLSPGNDPSLASPLAATMDAALPSGHWV